MTIATWNVNSVKARMTNVLDWLREAGPDVVLFQETKTVDGEFPRLEFESMGYHIALCGQKTYNGVAILSRRPILETSTRLPGDVQQGEARYIEGVLEGGLRVASIYVPMGQSPESDRFPFKLNFLDGVYERARELLPLEQPFVLGGDYNVAPEDGDVPDAQQMDGQILFHPEERARMRKLFHLGLTDAYRALNPEPHRYSWWDYRAGAWQQDHGLRIDHLLLSPQAADRLTESGIDRKPRGREKASDHTPVWCKLDL
nr:exodeoxyribonuclease III [Telmatospirillum sp. J64-1]